MGWRFDRVAYDGGAWWQVLTAQWVHFSWLHAGVNVLAAAVMVLAFRGLVDGRLQAVAVLGGYLGVAVVLVLDTGCAYYAGASGALHGLLAGSALSLLVGAPLNAAPRVQSRTVAGLLLAGLAAKLLLQRLAGDPTAPGWLGMATYYPAHEAGAAGGLLAVLFTQAVFGRCLAQPGRRK